MQTNREDCGNRYREIILPKPSSATWAEDKSRPFRDYFEAVAQARDAFIDEISASGLDYVANVRAVAQVDAPSDAPDSTEDGATATADE
jgi:type I restriction enzyme M protein